MWRSRQPPWWVDKWRRWAMDSKVGNILAKAIAIRKAWCCIRNVSCVWFVCCAVHLLPRCSSQHSFLHQFHDHRSFSVGPTCLRALLCSSFLQGCRCATCFFVSATCARWRRIKKKNQFTTNFYYSRLLGRDLACRVIYIVSIGRFHRDCGKTGWFQNPKP